MPKTRAEVVAEAHRRIAVLSVDENPSSDQLTYGTAQADALFAELLAEPHAMGFTWTLEQTPDAAFRPLAWLLATQLAPHYLVSPPESEARAMGRLRAYAFPDDRLDFRDIDENMTISTDEVDAGDRAAYY